MSARLTSGSLRMVSTADQRAKKDVRLVQVFARKQNDRFRPQAANQRSILNVRFPPIADIRVTYAKGIHAYNSVRFSSPYEVGISLRPIAFSVSLRPRTRSG